VRAAIASKPFLHPHQGIGQNLGLNEPMLHKTSEKESRGLCKTGVTKLHSLAQLRVSSLKIEAISVVA
jgi:hypothetical protein